jgi:UTP--glucose-1-phosphate uridylyltransferase
LKAKNQLKKAVIPAAGMGTRMQSLTNVLPKEMLPIGGKPMISYAIQEAALCNLDEIFIVINEHKAVLRRFLESEELARAIPSGRLAKAVSLPSLTFVNQPIPRGSGDAICRARECIGDEPFALMMPDFVFFDCTPALAQLIPLYERFNRDIVGLIQVSEKEAEGFGNVGIVEGHEHEPGVLAIRTLSDKLPGTLTLSEGEVIIKAVPRWIIGPHFFEYLDRTRVDGEWDDTPALQLLCAERKVMGKILSGKGFDVGNPVGYAQAQSFCRGA